MGRLALLLMFALAALAPAQAQEREWTSSQIGKFKARFVREVDGDAMFLRDGRPLTVPLDDLSVEDREAIAAVTSPKTPSDSTDNGPATGSSDNYRDERFSPVPGEANGKVRSLGKSKTSIVSRDWTDAFGYRTNGAFVRVFDRTVLIRRGERTAKLPFDSLSRVDQDYVNQILTEAGEQPLTAFVVPRHPPGSVGGLPATPFPTPQFAEADEPEGGTDSPQSSDPQQSQFFLELRKRQEQRRQDQAEFSQDNPVPFPTTPGTEAPEVPAASDGNSTSGAAASESPPAGQSSTRTGSGASSSGTLRIDAKTMAELRPVIIFAGILLGLFAVCGVVMFIATTIASSNAPRGQRRLY